MKLFGEQHLAEDAAVNDDIPMQNLNPVTDSVSNPVSNLETNEALKSSDDATNEQEKRHNTPTLELNLTDEKHRKKTSVAVIPRPKLLNAATQVYIISIFYVGKLHYAFRDNINMKDNINMTINGKNMKGND